MSDILLFPPSLLALENTRKKKKREGDFWTEQLPEQNFSLIFFFPGSNNGWSGICINLIRKKYKFHKSCDKLMRYHSERDVLILG